MGRSLQIPHEKPRRISRGRASGLRRLGLGRGPGLPHRPAGEGHGLDGLGRAPGEDVPKRVPHGGGSGMIRGTWRMKMGWDLVDFDDWMSIGGKVG